MRISRLRYLWKTPLRFSSWVCLGSLNRSSPTLDDSSRTYQTALPQPFVAFLSPSTYQRLFRIRCGVNSNILTESLTGFLSNSCRPTRKRSSTPVLATRIASSGIRASAFSCLDFFQFQLFRVIYSRVLFCVGSWIFCLCVLEPFLILLSISVFVFRS